MIPLSDSLATSVLFYIFVVLVAFIALCSVIVLGLVLHDKMQTNAWNRVSSWPQQEIKSEVKGLFVSFLVLFVFANLWISTVQANTKIDQENVEILADKIIEAEEDIEEETGTYTTDQFDLELQNPELEAMIADTDAYLDFKKADALQVVEVTVGIDGENKVLTFE